MKAFPNPEASTQRDFDAAILMAGREMMSKQPRKASQEEMIASVTETRRFAGARAPDAPGPGLF